MQTFERVLWRVLRGNLYLNYAEIDEPIVDPSTDETVEKNVFVIFAHGKVLLDKIRKISESLGATLYPVDDSPDRRRASLLEFTTQINDYTNVIKTTNDARKTELTKIADSLTVWMTIIRKEKAVYHTMNLFNYDVTRKCLIAEGWCPQNDLPEIHRAIRTATVSLSVASKMENNGKVLGCKRIDSVLKYVYSLFCLFNLFIKTHVSQRKILDLTYQLF